MLHWPLSADTIAELRTRAAWCTQNGLAHEAIMHAAQDFECEASLVEQEASAVEIGFFQLFDTIVLARILIAQGRLAEAGCVLPAC